MICRILVSLISVAYGLALFALLVGTFGWFGQERDPLSGVFLLPLGLPWVWAVDLLPDTLRAAAAAVAPLVNVCIALMAGRHARRVRGD